MDQQPSYSYTRLADLKKCNTGEKIHVFAKVAEVRNTRSVDIAENVQIVSIIYLRDSSVETFTRCVIYSELTDTFAEKIKNDQVIQLNHVHIRTNPGRQPSLYGKLNVAGFSVVLITDQSGSGFNILFHSSPSYRVPENSQQMIAALKVYSNNMLAVSSTTNTIFGSTLKFSNGCKTVCRLNQLIPYQYKDIVVQAVSILVNDKGNVVLRCWDTTKPPSSILLFTNENICETIFTDNELNSIANGYHCDVVCYNEHGDYLKRNVKPGDVLLLINVHYYVMKDSKMLAMHGGGQRYNRGIRILDDSSSQKAELLNIVKAFIKQNCFDEKSI